MRKSPIRVKLQAGTFASASLTSYLIKEISGAITLGSYDGKILRVGDAIDEKQAEKLTESYLVTVVRK